MGHYQVEQQTFGNLRKRDMAERIFENIWSKCPKFIILQIQEAKQAIGQIKTE